MARPATLPAPSQAAVVLTRKQLAARWQCSERSIDNWVADGRIGVLRLGRNVRFHIEEVERCEREGLDG